MRRLLVPTLTAIALTAAPGPAAPALARATRARAVPEQPNIVLIMTDDQTRVDLRWMPLTRELIADRGVTFTDALAPNPVCGPSRATVLTGQYSHNTGIHGNDSEQTLLDRTRLLPAWLREVGYHTGFVGKYVNRYRLSDDGEPGWDWFSAVTYGSHYFDYTMTNNGDPKRYPDVHIDDTVAEESEDLIAESAGDEPFFIWSSYPAPHGVCLPNQPCDDAPIPAVRHEHLYPHAVAPQLAKPSFNEKDMSDKPRRVRKLPRVDRKDVQHDFRERIRALASVDEAVASTVDALDAAGELDDTLIAFTSDNGFELGEHRHTGKVFAYEESIGVPLLLAGPGVPAGEVRGRTVTMADLAVTLAAYAGAAPALTVDGRDLGPYVRTGVLRSFTAELESGLRRNDWTYRAVRTERYTFVRWRDGERELYDRRHDRYQLHNLASVRPYGPVERALTTRLRALARCVGTEECSRGFPRLPHPRRGLTNRSPTAGVHDRE